MTTKTAPRPVPWEPTQSPRRYARLVLAAVAVALTLTTVLSACDDVNGTAPALKYSKCMRAHGVTGFPDPQPNGRITINQAPGGATGDLDASNPTFKKADDACKHYLP